MYQPEQYNEQKPESRREIRALAKSFKDGLEKSPSWHKTVYKSKRRESGDLVEFHTVAKEVFKRDGQKCMACWISRAKLLRMERFLTAHHLIARSDGGENNHENLLTLCNVCHDQIEELGIKTKEEINGYFTKDKRRYVIDDAVGESWQQWVYGGKRNPNKIR